jgi:uncharacterized protein (DUF1501 family)
MNDIQDFNGAINRRQFFRKGGFGLGVAALGTLLGESALAGEAAGNVARTAAAKVAPKAKRIIYLSMIGAPSQLDLFDHKPDLAKRFNQDLTSFLKESGQRLTGMTSGQSRFPAAPSVFKFAQHGKGGAWISELLPWTAKMADDLCIIKSMHTEAINHEPANQLMYTGNMQAGKASMGSWMSYGLGSLNKDLPTFAVLHAQHSSPQSNVQAISARLWGAGFLPGQHAGVTLRTKGDPVLYLKDAPGIDRDLRRKMLDGLGHLNRMSYEAVGDPETQVRIQQYEMAFRMQASVPELADLSGEPASVTEMYGKEVAVKGSFAHCALLARRLAERGVRFVQIFHRGWDQHGNLPKDLADQCRDIDRASWALIQDLKQRGMLDDTLVIWGGEFGRTVYSQGTLTQTNYGRDHHPRAFTIWMAGGGVKPGFVLGETDEFSYNITQDPVHIRDLHATVLNLVGLDHEKLHVRYQGLDQKLTGVEHAKVVKKVLA